MNAETVPLAHRKGVRYFHYQDDIRRLGSLVASQTPSDSGVSWWVYGPLTAEQIKAIETPGTYPTQSHDCSGQYFDRGIYCERQTKTRTLFKCNWGYDV